MFLTYEWPGNIRELENMMKRLVILQDEQLVIREITRAIKPVAAPAPAFAAAAAASTAGPHGPLAPESEDFVELDEEDAAADEPVAPSTGSRLADAAKAASIKAERAMIEETLQQVRWNRRRAAEQLGVSYKTLLNKIKECGISRK
jgi:two-component system response regulator AtoC